MRWRVLALNLDTLVVHRPRRALRDLEFAGAGEWERCGRGQRRELKEGAAVEIGTKDSGPTCERWTIGPAQLWRRTIDDIGEEFGLLSADLYRVDVARDIDAADHDRGCGVPVLPLSPAVRQRCVSRVVKRHGRPVEVSGLFPLSRPALSLVEAHALAWAAGRPATVSELKTPGDDWWISRGAREKTTSLTVYHKTSTNPRYQRNILHYAPLWWRAGWPGAVCGCGATTAIPGPHVERGRVVIARCEVCGIAVRWSPVVRQEVRFPRVRLVGRRWADLKHALGWPRESRGVVAALADTPAPWETHGASVDAAAAAASAPRGARLEATFAGKAKALEDLATHYVRAALEMGVAAAGESGELDRLRAQAEELARLNARLDELAEGLAADARGLPRGSHTRREREHVVKALEEAREAAKKGP